MPKTGLKSDQLIEKIITLAEKKIRSCGFERFTLTDLARDLQVSHAALYKHVPGKEALLDLVSQKWLYRIDNELEHIISEKLPAVELIIRWFTRYYALKKEKILNDPELYRSFNMSVEAKKPFVQNHLAELSRQLTTLVEKAKSRGFLHACPTPQTVQILLDSTTAFHHPRIIAEQKELDRTDDLVSLLQILFAGLSR